MTTSNTEAERIIEQAIVIPEAALADLARRLDHVRWPEAATVDDWSQGVPLDRMLALCDYWRVGYDWRRCEAMLNGWSPARTRIDGLDIAFFHIRSKEPAALPLIMTHGWPGSVIEFARVVGPLTDPLAHGGAPDDAFHLILPCLPGFGFSGKPDATGWGIERIASAWATLIARLGYDRWVAQGGDWGAGVTARIAASRPEGCVAVHLNEVHVASDPADAEDDSPEGRRARERREQGVAGGMGYATEQASVPQTIGYALTDSPVGQAAWIYEKLKLWMAPGADPDTVFGMDAILDNIMLYWLTGSAASSARLYWESLNDIALADEVTMPVAVSLFPEDNSLPTRTSAKRVFKNIVRWTVTEAGGHLAAFEQPDIFVREVRAGFRHLRSRI